jgi:hypothetical protein
LLSFLRKEKQFGFAVTDFTIFLVYYAFFTILYISLTYARENRESFDYGFFLWAWATIYLARSIVLPCLETFWIFGGLKPSSGINNDATQIPLSDVLATPLGYNYFFAHLLNEFSEENLLCWKAIETLRRNTSHQRMMDILSKFIENDAVFMINIPGKTRAEIRASVLACNEQTSLQVIQSIYDPVQIEVFRLMQGDSFVRFKSSQLFVRYQSREPFDFQQEDSESSATIPGRGSRTNSFVKSPPTPHGLSTTGDREGGSTRIKLELGVVTGRDSITAPLTGPPSPTAATTPRTQDETKLDSF